MVVVVLYRGAHTIEELRDHLDALNHARYSEEEIAMLLAELVA